MRADIVERLRDWAATICMVRGMGGDVPASKPRMALEAADEIERLRERLASADAERMHAVSALGEDADTLRTERDAARRELCMVIAGKCGKSAFVSGDAVDEARRRGWDCFKENP